MHARSASLRCWLLSAGAFGRLWYTIQPHSSRGLVCLDGRSHSSHQARRSSEMSHSNPKLHSGQLVSLRRRWSRTPSLLANAVLPLAQVQAILKAEAVQGRDRIFTPLVTCVPWPSPRPRSLLPASRGARVGLAGRLRSQGLLGREWRLLQSPATIARARAGTFDARHWPATRRQAVPPLALARTPGQDVRR